VKSETFFDQFDLFADASNAVATMRELLIHFAVVGKLVRNDSEEKPVALKLSGALAGESSFPANWRSGLLGDVFNFEYGDNLPAPKRSQSGEYPVYGSNGIVGTHETYLTNEPAIIVGRKGSAGALNIATGPSWTTDVAYFVRPPRDIDLRFTYYLFSTLRFDDLGKGIKPGLSRKEAYALRIALPPLAEQKRIVAKVDELMALCDRLEAQQQERETRHAALARASLARFADAPTPANLDFIFHKSYNITPADLRKSILTLAVRGRLVPQDPNDEPAEASLVRIAATKLRLQKTGDIGREKPVEPLQPGSLPFDAPDSWQWAKLSELTELITKGSSPKWQGIAYVSESEGILFITSENVGNYVLRKLDDLKYVSKGFNEIEPRSILKRGDILMNLVGASIGRTAVYDLHDGANINQAVALIRLVRDTDGVCPRFLLHYLNSPSAIDYMLSSRVVNAQPNISLTDAREFAVPIPPLAEQRRIVAKVEQLMALVDALETQLAASRATAANLLSALVAELTGTASNHKVSAKQGTGTGRRGRPPKSA